jgi:hypothetical protein
MSSETIAQISEKLSTLAGTTHEPALRDAIRVLGDAITAGNISNSTGVAIGRNIRQVINQFNVPPDATAVLLDIRALLGTSLGLDTERYQWGTFVADRTREFIGRNYVFQEIDHFLATHRNGYFTISGDPGLGKSSILAEYVRRTGCIVHFNMRALGINNSTQFLQDVCAQIIADVQLSYPSMPVDAMKDGVFLSKLLQEATKHLKPGERLVIAIDALDEVDLSGHPSGANILFLPTVLPDSVYFIMTRRQVDIPFVVQAPQVLFDLMAHPAENRRDVETYLERALERPGLRKWIDGQGLTGSGFVTVLAELSETNFMYLRYVLPEIESGTYQNLSIERLPTGLESYYDDHWRHMGMTAKPLPRVKIRIVYILSEVRQPVSRQLISEFATDQTMQVDQLAVQEVLDEWTQFLHEQPSSEGMRYSVYHASFRDFLHRKDIVQAASVTIKEINALIADNLWQSLFGKSKL